jgi:hypothetical protein
MSDAVLTVRRQLETDLFGMSLISVEAELVEGYGDLKDFILFDESIAIRIEEMKDDCKTESAKSIDCSS